MDRKEAYAALFYLLLEKTSLFSIVTLWFDFEYEIEYKYDFGISSKFCHSSLLLTTTSKERHKNNCSDTRLSGGHEIGLLNLILEVQPIACKQALWIIVSETSWEKTCEQVTKPRTKEEENFFPRSSHLRLPLHPGSRITSCNYPIQRACF